MLRLLRIDAIEIGDRFSVEVHISLSFFVREVYKLYYEKNIISYYFGRNRPSGMRNRLSAIRYKERTIQRRGIHILFFLVRENYTHYYERVSSLIVAAIDCRTLEKEVSGRDRWTQS